MNGPNKLLQTAYRNGLVLAIGAGSSRGSQIPTWHELLKRVSTQLDAADLFDELRRADYPLPTIASVLEQRCQDRKQFINHVRDALYGDHWFRGARIEDPVISQRFVHDLDASNPTLRALSALCAAPYAASGQQRWGRNGKQTARSGELLFRANPLVKAVVSFNLDTLLREHTQAKYGPALLRSVDRASADPHPNKISLFYIHGSLRFDSKEGERGKESDEVVLTEQDYYRLLNDPMNVFNYAFMFLLREHSMLFVGLSMRDDNLRRLLYQSWEERRISLAGQGRSADSQPKHFAFLPRLQSDQLQEAEDRALAALGVHAIRLNSYDDIPDVLGRLYGSNWPDVFA